jgi:uncharacterized protein YcbK (DUF882 family)
VSRAARRGRALVVLSLPIWFLSWIPAAEKEDVPDEEFLLPLRGRSGALRVALRLPGSALSARPPSADHEVLFEPAGEGSLVSGGGPEIPGVYGIVVKAGGNTRKVKDLSLVTLVPFAALKDGRIGDYEMGAWPSPPGRAAASAYEAPKGFVEVTKKNESLRLSKHFELKDFLTRDQEKVWPKYIVLEERLLDKLELVVQELEASGRDVDHVHVMSGFRTPTYNESGGDTSGRGRLSRHMWGDAADIWVDDDGNGVMDDLNDDGRVDIEDARVIAAAAERVEARHPALAGGIGPYPACCGHGPFTHIDVRGSRARWQGLLRHPAEPGLALSGPRSAPRADRG